MATGCDNVAWGGVEVRWQSPPTSAVQPVSEDEVVEETTPARELGPLLLAGTRVGSRANLSVVGEIQGDALSSFPHPEFMDDDVAHLETILAEGSEWVLFAEGVRVGRLIVDEVGAVPGTCAPGASVSGMVELLPEASGADRFLALAAADAADRRYGEYASASARLQSGRGLPQHRR